MSSRGALGRYQLMPTTAAALGVNPLDPMQARAGARRLLLRYWRRYGSVEHALAAYCAGPKRSERRPWAPAVELYIDRVLVRAGMRQERGLERGGVMLAEVGR